MDFDSEFREYREQLHSELRRLVSYTKVYKRLHERKSDRLREMNCAPAFFGTAMDALYSSIIIWAHKLFDSRGERGIWNFLAKIENNRDEFSVSRLKARRGYGAGHWMLKREDVTFQDIKRYRDLIQSNETVRRIALRRDKYYAHFDKDYFFAKERFGDEDPLEWEALEELECLGFSILNEFSVAFDGQSFHDTPMNIHDVDRLLNRVKKSYEES